MSIFIFHLLQGAPIKIAMGPFVYALIIEGPCTLRVLLLEFYFIL